MSLIDVPDFLAYRMAAADLRLERIDFQMRSAFTRQRQVLSWPSGHMWTAQISVPYLQEPESGRMRSFLVKMKGRANSCKLPVPGYTTPSSEYAGLAGVVDGAGQVGYALETDGWTPSTLIALEGAYFTVGDQLKIATADVTSDVTGAATFNFEPPLRAPPDDNSAVVIENPYCVMSLAEGATGWSIEAPAFNTFPTLVLEESVNYS